MNYTDIKSRVRSFLDDIAAVRYSDDMLQEAIRQALLHYSAAAPQYIVETVTTVQSGADQSLVLSGLSGSASSLVKVMDVTHTPLAYIGTDFGTHIEAYYQYFTAGSPMLHVQSPVIIDAGDELDLRYAATHTINGLDGAAVTTIPLFHLQAIIIGAAAFASLTRALTQSSNLISRPSDTAMLKAWGDSRMDEFNNLLENIRRDTTRPAWEVPENAIPTTRPALRWHLDQWDK